MNQQTITSRYENLQIKYNGLTQRERGLTALAGVCIILVCGFVFFIEPMMISMDKKQTAIERKQLESEQLDETIAALQVELSKDIDAPFKARLERVKKQIIDADKSLISQTSDLVAAAKMPLLLENVFAQFAELKLIEMQSIAPTQLLTSPNKKSKSPLQDENAIESNLYQHGVKLTLQGRYFDIQKYLERVEALPWQFYWKKFSYQVVDYPIAEVVVEIYTLSTTKAFIGVNNDA